MGMVPPKPGMLPLTAKPPAPAAMGPVTSGSPLGKPPMGGVSPALSDFIAFQTMMAASKNLHLKDKNRVSVAKTSFYTSAVAAGVTAVATLMSAINGQSEKLFLIPIIGTLAALQGAAVGLLLNHKRNE